MMNANCWMGHGFFFGGPLGMFIGIIFCLFLAFGVFYIISRLFKNKSDNVFQKDTPLDILKRRYASGEINAEEYQKGKTTLLS